MRRRLIWTGILSVYVLFIFSNSMTVSSVSSAQSGRVLETVQGFLSAAGFGGLGITEHIIRKLAHFGEYTVLGLLLGQTFGVWFQGESSPFLPMTAAGFTIPFCDETIQLFVEGRSGQISDVWLDMSGILFGSLIFFGILFLKHKKGEKS